MEDFEFGRQQIDAETDIISENVRLIKHTCEPKTLENNGAGASRENDMALESNLGTQLEQTLLVEEYKDVKKRVETFESWYYRMLLACVSAFAVIVGFSERIESMLIPILMSLPLAITGMIGPRNRRHQWFTSAYLLERYDSTFAGLDYEASYVDLFGVETNHERYRWLLFIQDPFVLLSVFSLGISSYFGFEYIVENVRNQHYQILIPYLATVIVMHGIVLVGAAYETVRRIPYYRALHRKRLDKTV